MNYLGIRKVNNDAADSLVDGNILGCLPSLTLIQ